jgi:hypothetical protein
MKPQDFYTRKRANEGARLTLFDGNGNPTDAWVLVRGLDSDAYRAAHDASNRAMVRLAAAVRAKGSEADLPAETQAEKNAAALAERVALVAGWNLEGECTPAAIEELLQEAPYLSDQIYYAACDRDRFLGSALQSSTTGQSTSSSSASQPQTEPRTP